MRKLPDTFEEFVAEWREKEKEPQDPNVNLTCLCGKCDLTYRPATDEDLQRIWNILQSVDDNSTGWEEPEHRKQK